MRGGTANCSVILSDTPVGSPIVTNPDILIAMSLHRSTSTRMRQYREGRCCRLLLIEGKVKRSDVEANYIPATKLAADENLTGLANMIILGKVLRHTELMDYKNVGRYGEDSFGKAQNLSTSI